MEVDGRRVGHVVVSIGLVALAVVVIVLFLAGVRKNSQIGSLRESGVAVNVTVSRCFGLMGGSGSNLVGYDCRGTFTIGGHRYNEAIPGDALHAPGARLRAVTVPGDPALISTASAVAAEHPSGRVFILPATLLGVLALLMGALSLRRRHVLPASPLDAPVTTP